jgi:hypothetical protein
MSLIVACFWWFDPYAAQLPRRNYGPRHVEILRNSMARHLTVPHHFVCITDHPEKLPSDIETAPLDRTTYMERTRFAKLMLFRRDIADILGGNRILYSDIDNVVVGNMDPVIDRTEPLVLYRNPNWPAKRRARFNTSMILLSGGCRPDLYENINLKKDPQRLRARSGGTDQAWISEQVDHDNPYWDRTHGVYNAMRIGDLENSGIEFDLPDDARIVFFPGKRNPSEKETQERWPWIKEHWY